MIHARATVGHMTITGPFAITTFLAAGVLLVGGFALAACTTHDEPAPAAPVIAVGQPLPALPLPDAADGRPRSIADFRGHKVLLHVFASW
jgi:hypothetical protein